VKAQSPGEQAKAARSNRRKPRRTSQSCKVERKKAQVERAKAAKPNGTKLKRTSQSCKAERDKTLRTNGFKAAEGS